MLKLVKTTKNISGLKIEKTLKVWSQNHLRKISNNCCRKNHRWSTCAFFLRSAHQFVYELYWRWLQIHQQLTNSFGNAEDSNANSSLKLNFALNFVNFTISRSLTSKKENNFFLASENIFGISSYSLISCNKRVFATTVQVYTMFKLDDQLQIVLQISPTLS